MEKGTKPKSVKRSARVAAARIRRCTLADHDAVRDICCATGVFGHGLEPTFSDRRLFTDLYVDPYLRYQPDLAWVLEEEGRVRGYLLGAVRPDFDHLLVRAGAAAVARAGWRRLRRNVTDQRGASNRLLRWLLTRSYLERPEHPATTAHLHFNLLPGARGFGLGIDMWRGFEAELRRRGIDHYYGELWAWGHHHRERAYRHFGLEEFDRVRVSLFDGVVDGPVWLVCAHKHLSPEN